MAEAFYSHPLFTAAVSKMWKPLDLSFWGRETCLSVVT